MEVRCGVSKVLFIGSNPSQSANSNAAFDMSSKSGKKLREWLLDAGVHNAIFYNVANRPTPNNRALQKKEIVAALPALKNHIEWERSFWKEDIYVVAVGKTAVTALTLLRLDFYEMPHPSGLNRKLNDPCYIMDKIKGLNEYINKPK